jgi:glyoxylase-like metal-dependent hydrolase (beta-lactamase superfamily II)
VAADGVALIPLPTPYDVGIVNAYLLKGDPLTLVDAGPKTEDSQRALEAGLAEHGARLEDVELVLLTHQHDDHVGNAQFVVDASSAVVAGLPKLAEFMRDVDAALDMDDRYVQATMVRHGVGPGELDAIRELTLSWRPFVNSVEVTQLVSDGDRITAGGRDFLVLEAPGHSPTDTLFFDEHDGLLIAGDHLIEGISSNPFIHWPIEPGPPEESALSRDRRRPLREYMTSLERTRDLDVSVVLPGHRQPFSDHRELIDARLSMHRRRAAKILQMIDAPVTAAELGSRIWSDRPAAEAYLIVSEVLGHLDMLGERGEVRELDENGVARFDLAGRRAA